MQRNRSRPTSVLAAVAVVIAAPLTAGAAGRLVEEETRISFPAEQTVGGVPYQCLGTGIRKASFLFLHVKVYAATFCLEPAGAKAVAAAAAGKSPDQLASDPSFASALMEAPGGKLVVQHFVRSVEKEKIADALKDSLGKVLSPEKVQKLTALISKGAKEGEEVKMSSQGNVLTVDVAGEVNRVEDAEIARKIWLVFLGPDSVTPALRKSIATRAVAGFQ